MVIKPSLVLLVNLFGFFLIETRLFLNLFFKKKLYILFQVFFKKKL
jgi:hypothetical protein